jgi:LuxR family transcriptional regulator, activator of conjugal transfer of Ti plasmids
MLARRAADYQVDASSCGSNAAAAVSVGGSTLDVRAALPMLSGCGTSKELRGWLLQLARGLGFYGARYVHIGNSWRDFGANDIQPPRRYLTTSPREEEVIEWLACDPCVEQARIAFAPFAWSTRTNRQLTARQRDWVETESARGVSAGVAVPVQDSIEGPGYLSFFGNAENAAKDLVAEHAPELAFAGAQFHALAKVLIPVTQWVPSFTKREIECLQLAVRGKTIVESGDLLGVSHRTVEFHLTNAAQKLGADSKVRAVALAVGSGLIQV